jgi:hypothetical protein
VGQLVTAGPVTQIAKPGDQLGFARAVDELLQRKLPANLNNPWARSRLAALASWASGWNVGNTWHYNLWAVRKGGWPGDWYQKGALEEVNGKLVDIPAEHSLWRSYPSFDVAALDVIEVMRRYYPAGFGLLSVAGDDGDFAWVDALHKSGWMTDSTGRSQAAVSSRAKKIRKMLGTESLEASRDQSGSSTLADIGILLVLLAAGLAFAALIWVKQ